MALFKKYRTVPRQVQAVLLTPINIERIAKLCGGIVIEKEESTPANRLYLGMEIKHHLTHTKRRVNLGWYVVRRAERDGGGYAFYAPNDFIVDYEPVAL